MISTTAACSANFRLATAAFLLVLRDAGRDRNDPASPYYRSYAAGYNAIKALFPGSPTDTESAGGGWQGEETHRQKKRGLHIILGGTGRGHCRDFAGVILDESSILKSFDGERRSQITEFMRTRPYRMLATATAAPNDYIELGTSSEALGDLRRPEMLAMFFSHEGATRSDGR